MTLRAALVALLAFSSPLTLTDGCQTGTTWYADRDYDGYGNPDEPYVSEEQPPGYVADGTDCNDKDATTYPGAVELCDNVDNNCDGLVDNECSIKEVCDATGGAYSDCGCGSVTCDDPDPGAHCPIMCVPSCECPKSRPIFDPVQGCVPATVCDTPSDPQELCKETGGMWTDCGSGCGPATCEVPVPGPICPDVCQPQCVCPADAPLWDEAQGCIPKDACPQ